MVHTYADISKKKRQKLKEQKVKKFNSFKPKAFYQKEKSIEMNDKDKIKESPRKLRRENEEPN